MPSNELRHRVADRIESWRVIAEHTVETECAVLIFGRRAGQPVVLKVIKDCQDEWRAGEILDTFEGRGVVRVYEFIEGALLLERLNPGRSLVDLTLNGSDSKATTILAHTIRAMSPRTPADSVPTVKDWGAAFDRYADRGSTVIPDRLLSAARRVYWTLCSSQNRVRLLHGDLHHANVLFDGERGWLAIDPTGVVGEIEFEAAAALRNPHDWPMFVESSVIRSRIGILAGELDLDSSRVVGWAFSQAVLSVIWALEDGLPAGWGDKCLALAAAMLPMLDE
jgi:streptomycin 6-kinase